MGENALLILGEGSPRTCQKGSNHSLLAGVSVAAAARGFKQEGLVVKTRVFCFVVVWVNPGRLPIGAAARRG